MKSPMCKICGHPHRLGDPHVLDKETEIQGQPREAIRAGRRGKIIGRSHAQVALDGATHLPRPPVLPDKAPARPLGYDGVFRSDPAELVKTPSKPRATRSPARDLLIGRPLQDFLDNPELIEQLPPKDTQILYRAGAKLAMRAKRRQK